MVGKYRRKTFFNGSATADCFLSVSLTYAYLLFTSVIYSLFFKFVTFIVKDGFSSPNPLNKKSLAKRMDLDQILLFPFGTGPENLFSKSL